MPTRVRSHAKINLGLYIGAPRPDGFHELATVYQTLEIHDFVTVAARPAAKNAIRITSNDVRVPTDSRNTAWKMVELALEALEISAEVEIHIEKRLPVQGGLGAGSANAVAALIGLETELGIGESASVLSHPSGKNKNAARVGHPPELARDQGSGIGDQHWPARRLEIAARVGSDVPLFLVGGTVLGVDRGQEVSALPDFEPVWCVLAVPAIGVSTQQAFRDWDERCSAGGAAEGLTPEASASKLKQLSRAYASAFNGNVRSGSSGVLSDDLNGRKDLAGPHESALVRTGILSWIQNDFEQVVFAQHPPLCEIKRLLASAGTPEAALHASLSGSGSALFGLYMTRGAAEAALERLSRFAEVSGGVPVQGTLTRTLPRSAYWSEMLL
jgi:4-diphosphocytidyl-2-C-methyl-D-erythritol kinase